MSICCNHTVKLSIMIVMVMLYFLAELIVGYILNSIALVADAYHMLSDFLALIVGVTAHRVGKWPRSNQNTFGWQRAEVVGTQVNTVMLATLSFTIFVDCLKRFAEPVAITNPKLLLWVGSGGLLINIIGLVMLRDHHGHSHGNNVVRDIPDNEVAIEGSTAISIQDHQKKHNSHGHNHSSSRMNTRAVFLHVLSDFFGSIAVVVSALILWLVPNTTNNPKGDPWKNYIDPSISLVMVVLIIIPTIPLLKKSTLIILQSVPDEVLVQELKDRMDNISGIQQVHDLHVWLLHSDVIIGTVHICCSYEDYFEISKKVKKLFHDFNIHCTTIQAELPINNDELDKKIPMEEGGTCWLYCEENSGLSEEDQCQAKQLCCPTKTKSIIEIIINDNSQSQLNTETITNNINISKL